MDMYEPIVFDANELRIIIIVVEFGVILLLFYMYSTRPISFIPRLAS